MSVVTRLPLGVVDCEGEGWARAGDVEAGEVAGSGWTSEGSGGLVQEDG